MGLSPDEMHKELSSKNLSLCIRMHDLRIPVHVTCKSGAVTCTVYMYVYQVSYKVCYM